MLRFVEPDLKASLGATRGMSAKKEKYLVEANIFCAAPSHDGGSATARFQVFTLGITVLLTAIVVAQDTAATKSQPQPCSAPEQKQMDFWVGDWDLTWPGNSSGDTGHGTNSIKRILNGCIVEENFSGGESMHLRGHSVSVFDARAGKWKQTWVDNEGGYLDFIGEFKDGQMVLAREAVRPDGSKVQQRMVFKNIGRNQFDWSWERSLDGGKTWEVLWPIHYKRKVKGDVAKLEKQTSDDYTLVNVNGQMSGKAQMVDAFKSGQTKQTRVGNE